MLRLHIQRELSQRHSIAYRLRHVVDVGLASGIGDGTLDCQAADGVGAVQNHDFHRVMEVGLLGGSGLEEVTHSGFIGPEVDACVLEIDNDSVEIFELSVRWPAVGVVRAVERDDGEVGGFVFLGELVGGVLLGGEAVFGGKESDKW